MTNTVILAASGKTATFHRISEEEAPKYLLYKNEYSTFWQIEVDGTLYFAGKGYDCAPNEIVVWNDEGDMFTGFGKSVTDAIEKMIDPDSIWLHGSLKEHKLL